MIKDEIAAKFHLPPIEEYPFPEEDYYRTFLIQSDYIVLKAMEATISGKKDSGIDNLSEIMQGRDYARQMINEIQNEATK